MDVSGWHSKVIREIERQHAARQHPPLHSGWRVARLEVNADDWQEVGAELKRSATGDPLYLPPDAELNAAAEAGAVGTMHGIPVWLSPTLPRGRVDAR